MKLNQLKFVWTIFAILLCSTPLFAQPATSAGVYVGVTSPAPSSFTGMVMADFGTAFDVEPWLQNYGREVQVGVDIVISPKGAKGLGVTIGAYSNTRTERLGIAYSFKNGQVRLLQTNTGLTQAIGYYNIPLPKANYLQVWLAPAQGGSSWLVGIGHTFKE